MVAEKQLVLITGSSGLIGRRLIDRLAPNYTIAGLDIAEPAHLPAGGTFHKADLSSDQSVEDALVDVRRQHGDRITSVVHLAAYYDFSGEPSDKYEQITVRGTERLLRGLESFHVEQFIFSSTMLVHAPCTPGEKINEDWPLEPRWDYPQSKVETEELIRRERGAMPAVMLRIAGVYDDFCNSIPLSNQIQRIHERRMTSRVFPGNPMHGQALVHMDDCVGAIARAIHRRRSLPEETVLLIGEPETLSYNDLQEEFGRLIHGEPWETSPITKSMAKTGAWFQEKMPVGEEPFIKPWMIDLADDHYELDISRSRDLLGWEPKHRLRDTLPKMIEALNADPLAWYEAHKLTPSQSLKHTAETATAAGRRR